MSTGCRPWSAGLTLDQLRTDSQTYLKPGRVPHVLGCERQAVLLAEHWGQDSLEAAVAGILHDITKALNAEEQLRLCRKYGIVIESAEEQTPKLLHAKTGAALARELYGTSPAVTSAILWHTTGKPGMTPLEKIIYLADFTEPTRDFPGVDRLRQLCLQDLDRAMALGLEMSVEEIRSYGTEPYHVTLEALDYYCALQHKEK